MNQRQYDREAQRRLIDINAGTRSGNAMMFKAAVKACAELRHEECEPDEDFVWHCEWCASLTSAITAITARWNTADKVLKQMVDDGFAELERL